jgi:putative transposase
VRSVTKNTVRNILKAEGLAPGPKRGEGSWDEFIKRHAATLWATDFFSKKVWTARGLVDVFVLFFIHVGSGAFTCRASRRTPTAPG